MNVVHEAGHALAAKTLGYDARVDQPCRLVPARAIRQPIGWRSTCRPGSDAAHRGRRMDRGTARIAIALSVLLVALAMRIIAAVASLGTPNDEARRRSSSGSASGRCSRCVIAILLALFVSASARDASAGAGSGSYIGASLGFATIVFGEPFLPT